MEPGRWEFDLDLLTGDLDQTSVSEEGLCDPEFARSRRGRSIQ